MTEYTRFQLALKPDDPRDQAIIQWLTSHPDGVTGAIRQAVEGFTQSLCNGVTQSITQNSDEPAPRQAADITQSITQRPDVGDDSLIVQSFQWLNDQQQSRHDVLMTAIDGLTAALGKLQVQGVQAIAPGAPEPEPEPGRVDDATLKKRAERMKHAAWAR